MSKGLTLASAIKIQSRKEEMHKSKGLPISLKWAKQENPNSKVVFWPRLIPCAPPIEYSIKEAV